MRIAFWTGSSSRKKTEQEVVPSTIIEIWIVHVQDASPAGGRPNSMLDAFDSHVESMLKGAAPFCFSFSLWPATGALLRHISPANVTQSGPACAFVSCILMEGLASFQSVSVNNKLTKRGL